MTSIAAGSGSLGTTPDSNHKQKDRKATGGNRRPGPGPAHTKPSFFRQLRAVDTGKTPIPKQPCVDPATKTWASVHAFMLKDSNPPRNSLFFG